VTGLTLYLCPCNLGGMYIAADKHIVNIVLK
jgi:hypothetical protein